MAGFYLWETANLTLRIAGEDALTDYEHVIVSIAQHGSLVVELDETVLGIDPAEQTINVHLTQEQTGSFSKGAADVQVNIYYTDTERDATCKGQIDVLDNLHKQVMG